MSAYFDAAMSGLTPKFPINTPTTPASSNLRPQSGSTSSSPSLKDRVTEKGGTFGSIISAICRLIARIWPSSVSTQASGASSSSKLLASFEKPYKHTFEASSYKEVGEAQQKRRAQETETATVLGRFEREILVGEQLPYQFSFDGHNVKDSSTVKKAKEELEALTKQMEKDAIDKMPFTVEKQEQLKKSRDPAGAVKDFATHIKSKFVLGKTEGGDTIVVTEKQALAVVDGLTELTIEYREKLKEKIKQTFKEYTSKESGDEKAWALQKLIGLEEDFQGLIQEDEEGQARKTEFEKVLPTEVCAALQTWAGYGEGDKVGPVSYGDPYYVVQAILSEGLQNVNLSEEEVELSTIAIHVSEATVRVPRYNVVTDRSTHQVNLCSKNGVPTIESVRHVKVQELLDNQGRSSGPKLLRKYQVKEEYRITKGAEGEPCKVTYSRSMTPITE